MHRDVSGYLHLVMESAEAPASEVVRLQLRCAGQDCTLHLAHRTTQSETELSGDAVGEVMGQILEFAFNQPPGHAEAHHEGSAMPGPRFSVRSIPGGAITMNERKRASNGYINGVNCNPSDAEHIYISPAGSNCFTHDGFRRFDESLYRNADGYFFLVRPLAPDEAREWLEDDGHDDILAKAIFPPD